MNKTNRNILLISSLLMLGWFSFSFFCGERIKENQGLGWDGIFYAGVALNPLEYITKIGVNDYQFSRLLPSFVVHYAAKLVGYQLGNNIMTPEAVLNAFAVCNILLILSSAILLYLIAKHFDWTPPILIVSFTALFVNFPILKLSTYYPALTDVSAFTISLLVFYIYLKNWQFMLFFVSLFAAFIWPTMLYTAIPLLIFKVQNFKYQKIEPSRLCNVLSAIIAGLLAAGVFYDYFYNSINLPNGTTQVNGKVIVFSIILFFTFIWLMLRPFIDLEYLRSSLFSRMNFQGIILSLILLIIVKLITATFSKGAFYLTPMLQIRYLGQSSIVNPLVNVVAHVSYFGPVVILTFLFWKNVVSVAKQYGPGLMFVLIFSALLSIGSESRQSMAAWPIFAVMTCEVLNRRGVTWRMAYSLLCVGLLTSRFWLNINGKENWTGPYNEFPYQMFFMNIGPWLSNSMYSVFAAITSILFIWLFLSMRYHGEYDAKPPADHQENKS